jgi:hypothetical protein
MQNTLNKEQALIAHFRNHQIEYRTGTHKEDWRLVGPSFMWENAGSQTTQFRVKPLPYIIPVRLVIEEGIVRVERGDNVIPNAFLTVEDEVITKVRAC